MQSEMIPKELYYQDKLIAFLSNSHIEWPRSASIYKINKDLKGELVKYIRSSINYSILIGNNDEKAMRNHVDNEEVKFLHLIESDEWFIIDQAGKKHNILVPIFHPDNYVVWMLK